MSLSKLTGKYSLTLVLIFSLLIGFGLAYTISSNRPKTAAKNTDSCNGVCVALHENKADPETITIKRGSFVQFNSADGKSHNLSLGKGGEEHEHNGKFYSGEFGADEGWRVQFKDEGTFFFHDHLNPKINILVVVYTPDKQYKVQ